MGRAIAIGSALCLTLALLAPEGVRAQEDDGAAPARGWLSELRGGVLAHDVDGLWSNFSEEAGVALSAEVIFARQGLGVLWGRLRPNLGVTVNTSGDTSKLYAGLLWELRTPVGFFLDLSAGPAIHDGKLETRDDDRKELGSRVLIRTGLDLGWELFDRHRLMVSFDHISNAGLASPNHGLDTLGARYGFRF